MRSVFRSGAKSLTAFAGVFAGAYVLHTVDGSKWTESLASVATVVATGAALYIATRDRAERRADQLNTDRAQARLVQVEVDGPYRGSEDQLPRFVVLVEANGAQPILDVELEDAIYLVDDSRSIDLVGLPGVVPIVRPDRAPGSLMALFPSSDALATELTALGDTDAHGNYVNAGIHPENVRATVQFTDANGNRWRRCINGLVDLVEQC